MSQDTRPTSVYSSSSYTKQDDWGVTLGSMQAVVLVGLITGCMFCAFTFGYVSGKKIGFETALDATMASAAKFPVSEPEQEMELSPEDVNSVYASLQSDPVIIDQSNLDEKIEEVAKPIPVIEIDTVSQGAIVDSSDIEVVAVENKNLTQEVTDTLSEKIDSLASKTESSVSSIVKLAKKAEVAPVVVEDKIIEEITIEEKPVEKTLTQVKKDDIPSRIKSGWYAQVATSRNKSTLEPKAKKLRENGFPVTLNEMSAGGAKYYRLLVGPEDSKNLGDELMSQLVREPYITSRPFVRKY